MKVTLTDIAEKTNVTPSTVQRALNGSPGVSEKKRAEIQTVAREMGYRLLFSQYRPRSEAIRIAVVLPDTTSYNRYFSVSVWQGIEQCYESLKKENIELIRLTYERSPEDQAIRLQELLDGLYGKIDGVLARGSIFPEVLRTFSALHTRKIPVVLAGTDSYPGFRLCCVRSLGDIAGRMAADLLLRFNVLREGSSVIVCGNFTGIDQYNNSQGFEKQFIENAAKIQIMKIVSDLDPFLIKKNILNIIGAGTDVSAVYSCSARSGIAVCDAVEEAGKIGKISIIGSDLFPESVRRIQQGILSAVIHNKPSEIASCALTVLIDYLEGKNTSPQDTILIDSVIVMQGNLPYYTGKTLTEEKDPLALPAKM